MAPRPPLVSVVVMCRDDASLLPRALEGLLSQRADFPFEVIVVDSSADLAGARLAEDRFSAGDVPVVVERSDVGLTPGASRNRGVDRARGRFVAFLEADCVPRGDWLARRAARHLEGHPAVSGTVGCAPPRTLAARVQWLTRFAGTAPRGGRAGLADRPLFGWSYERRLLDRPFREDLPLGEDSEFNARLVAAGLRAWFDPAIRIDHIGLGSIEAVRAHQYRHGMAAAALLGDPGAGWLVERYERRGATVLVPAARWARTLVGIARTDPSTLGWFLALTPWSLASYRAWARGFVTGRSRHAGTRKAAVRG